MSFYVHALRLLKATFTKFFVVGSINALLTFVLFLSLYKFMGIYYLISLSASWCVGVVFSYTLNYLWVFKPDERISFRKRFAKYFTSNAASFLANLLVLREIVEVSHFDPFWVQTALIPVIVAVNFLLAKYWSLKRMARNQ